MDKMKACIPVCIPSSTNKRISCTVIRQLVINYHKDNKSLCKIGNLIGHSKPTVQTEIGNYKLTKNLQSKPRGGRPFFQMKGQIIS